MTKENSLRLASRLMVEFADKTGLTSSAVKERYLWTDAFAVCNFLGLYEVLKEKRHLDLALRLTDQVHSTLGYYNDSGKSDKPLSGLSQKEAALHPTIAGLRIGKPLPQREENEPYDERLEWERDGQYFHYLTKWMRALWRITELTGEYRYNRWAMELAKTAFEKFSHTDPVLNRKSLYWKMSIDLSRPLVTSMGQHDALDGWITFLQLNNIASKDPQNGIDLSDEIAQLKEMASYTYLPTADPLGIGGLLCDICFLHKMRVEGEYLFTNMFLSAIESLRAFNERKYLFSDASDRLAFRELGLSLGLRAIEKMPERISASFAAYLPLSDEIISYWADAKNRRNRIWTEHENINTVSLATALVPKGYLG